MQILNLINPTLCDGIGFDIVHFPDGEDHITLKNINRKDNVHVITRIANPNDLFILMQIGDILKRQEIQWGLSILYLMGGRMDRVISFNEAYTLKIVTDIINGLKPEFVEVFEPHSMKTVTLLENCQSPRLTNLNNLPIDHETGTLCFPDRGAADRYGSRIPPEVPVVYCSKVRNPQTGELSGFRIENPEAYRGGDIMLVDDLCDGGGTFVGIAGELRKIMAEGAKLSVHVTHMVNPKGIKNLSENFDEVIFSDSYKDWGAEKLPDNVTLKSFWK